MTFEEAYQKYNDENDPDCHTSMEFLFKWFYDAGQGSMADTANGAFMDGRNNAIAEREQEVCEWVPEDEDSNWYGSQCGMLFVFEDGGAVHNGFNFCPKCGKRLKEIPWSNSEDEDDIQAFTEECSAGR